MGRVLHVEGEVEIEIEGRVEVGVGVLVAGIIDYYGEGIHSIAVWLITPKK